MLLCALNSIAIITILPLLYSTIGNNDYVFHKYYLLTTPKATKLPTIRLGLSKKAIYYAGQTENAPELFHGARLC